VLVDAHSLAVEDYSPSYALGELLAHCLIVEAERHNIAGDALRWANDMHAKLVAQPSALLAVRYMERLCARLIGDRQLIFVFDAFDDLLRVADAQVFQLLRNLRDQFKYRLVYLVFSGNKFSRSGANLLGAESFLNLFIAHEFGLGMLTSTDAREVLNLIATRNRTQLENDQAELIVQLSGGHPGLLRALFWTLRDASSDLDAPIDPAELASNSSISAVCARIWERLSPNEQYLLYSFARGLPITDADRTTFKELEQGGLIRAGTTTLFCSLLAQYVVEHTRSSMEGIVVDVMRRRIWIDGIPLESRLGPGEFSLIQHLGQNAGKVCNMQSLHHALYPDESPETASAAGQRLDRIVGRLRSAIGQSGQAYLVRHPKVGIELTKGSVIGDTE
jgi:DNA-binding winged helix-turn-helix (wHTH) protein